MNADHYEDGPITLTRQDGGVLVRINRPEIATVSYLVPTHRVGPLIDAFIDLNLPPEPEGHPV